MNIREPASGKSPVPISVSVKAAVVRGSDVLLLEYADDFGPHFNLPGGKAKVGEPVERTVVRKVFEETGLTVRAGPLLLVIEYVPESWDGEFGETQKIQLNFLAYLDPLLTVTLTLEDDPTLVGSQWIPVVDLPKVMLLPRIGLQLRAAILNADRPNPLVSQW